MAMVWTFHLRQGVFVKRRRRRLLLTPRWHGFRDFQAEFISQITALDPFTVQIVLKMPFAPFISTVAGTAFSIVSPMAVRHFGESFTSNPVGTGPFKFVQWDRDDKIVLEANDTHWAGRPSLD